MLFCIECNALTDERGKAVSLGAPSRISYRVVEAPTAADAIDAMIRSENVELLGRMHRVGDIQALATVRRGRSAMTLHAYPEEETAWRLQRSR